MIAKRPEVLMPYAPAEAEHIILTYSHEIDLALCHAALSHRFRWAGVIGSDTKWARFRKRLAALGHSDAQIARICCPIGQKQLGKHPQAIAIGVAAQVLRADQEEALEWPTRFSA
jgi:xanthine dehydrogenase accessory factor